MSDSDHSNANQLRPDSKGCRPSFVVDVLADDSDCAGGVAFGEMRADGAIDPEVLPEGFDVELPDGRLIIYDAVQQLPRLENRSVCAPTDFDDLRIMGRLANNQEANAFDLGALIEQELKIPAMKIRIMQHSEFGEHLELMAQCYRILHQRIQAMGLQNVYAIELAIARMVANTSQIPVELDHAALDFAMLASTQLTIRLEALTGRRIDTENDHELAGVLYGHNNWRDDDEAKRALAPEHINKLATAGYPVAQEIQKHPRLTQPIRSILKRLSAMYEPAFSLDPLGTVVGGFTVNPPITALPNDPAIRRCIAAPAGHQFIHVDMRQQGTRVLAALAGDNVFLDAIKQGLDLHTLTASHVSGLPYEQIGPEWRACGKHVNLAIANGQHAAGLAEALNVPETTAESFRQRFFIVHPAIAAFQQRVYAMAQTGWAVTPLGRRRFLPNAAGTGDDASTASRQALNFVVAGTASDAFKTYLIEVMKAAFGCCLVLADQDSVLLMAPEEMVEHVVLKIKEVFAVPVPWLGIPLAVEVKTGPNWGALR
ncbi:MAG: DNA polymerase [Planctomycetota bacterium]